jgi:hypothetical protein
MIRKGDLTGVQEFRFLHPPDNFSCIWSELVTGGLSVKKKLTRIKESRKIIVE